MNNMTTPIIDFVSGYVGEETLRLHMPGHKGKSYLGFEERDITEIKGADSLYEADGIIKESEDNASKLFGCRTYYSTEGSSHCIRAMVYLCAVYAKSKGKKPCISAFRNVHKTFLSAVAMTDCEVHWLCGDDETYLSCSVSEEFLENHLKEHEGEITAVYLTSPDYLGKIADIKALSRVCHKHGVLLVVDNAHGAYLKFLPKSQHPIDLGADICCDSAHKTLPVVTGGAYLHLGKNAPIQDEATVRGSLGLFGSTSPSYLILQSLDHCNRLLAGEYPQQIARICKVLQALRSELNAVAVTKGCPAPFALETGACEPLKLTLDAASIGQTGDFLAGLLRSGGLECEYADPRYVVLMFTPYNLSADFEHLRELLLAQLNALSAPPHIPDNKSDLFLHLEQQLKTCCSIRQAVFAPQIRIPVRQALGRICAMPTVSCPPAIPIVVSGEQITEAAVELMVQYQINEVSVLNS